MARILISEPNADVRALLEHMVRRLGHEPLTLWAVNGEHRTTVDLLVIEPADPRSRELAGQLRAVSPALPVLAVSIVPGRPEELADEFLLKPVALESLRDAVGRLLPSDGRAAARL